MRSENVAGYGRERPRLRLPRVSCALVVPSLWLTAIGFTTGSSLDQFGISNGSQPGRERNQIATNNGIRLVVETSSPRLGLGWRRIRIRLQIVASLMQSQQYGSQCGSTGGEFVLHDCWDGWILFAMDNAIGLQPAQLVSERAAVHSGEQSAQLAKPLCASRIKKELQRHRKKGGRRLGQQRNREKSQPRTAMWARALPVTHSLFLD